MTLEISLLAAPAPQSLPVEIVERKGLGHPDSICDALAENLSLALSRAYLERFGKILHHNVDKALLVGGSARAAFGGGELLSPIEIYLAGRAVREVNGVTIPVDDIAIDSARAWLRTHLRHLDVDNCVRIHPRIRPVSCDLASVFDRGNNRPLANDTSFGVGYAPLDRLERAVFAAEQALSNPAIKAAHPAIGDDIKVMGSRYGERFTFTVACAMVGRYIADHNDYSAKKHQVRDIALAAVREHGASTADITVNAADGDTLDSLYLTVTGLSAESGDDGQVGRGNRANGLITPYRPMSLEAVAGKNPVSHIGKLYNLSAQRLAQALVDALPDITEAHCFMVSRIGSPIDDPLLVDIKLRPKALDALSALSPLAREIAHQHLAQVTVLWRSLLAQPWP